MASIKITELAGSALFSGSETFMDSMRDLTEDELKISGGGGYGGGSSKSKSRSKSRGKGHGKSRSRSKSRSKKCCYPCH